MECTDVFILYSGELHARIPLLLSLRYGVSPGAKEGGGDVAITSPFICRCRSFRPLLAYPSSHSVR